MSLTAKEKRELKALHESIYVVGCFGVRDLMRRAQLEARATEGQLKAVYGDAYYVMFG